MKKIIFVLSLILWCSCSNDEILIDYDGESPATRTAFSDRYSFEIYGGAWAPYYQYDCKGNLEKVTPGITSYYEGDDGITEQIIPEVSTKPVWVDSVAYQNTMYVGMVVPRIYMQHNTSSVKRSGEIVFKQPGSNKTLSLQITQNGSYNYIRIQVNKTYNNHYEFIATTDYPVRGKFWVRIPIVVYNDGGEMTQEIAIDIAKGERTGSSEADWNSSPLVQEHGDIKGYRLYEGRFGGEDDVYTYSFIRYW